MSTEKNESYNKPEVKRIDLVLEETLTAGCKAGTVEDPCTAPGPFGPEPTSEFGS